MSCEARAAMTRFDTIVIGAGISGASLAFALASDRRVLLLEAEAAPGYHSTGRSAALYTRNYGPPVVQRINAASHAFFVEPPPGFTDVKLLRPRGAITVAAPGDEARLDAVLALDGPGNRIDRIDAARVLAMAPLLRAEAVAAAAHEPGVMDMDVAAIHQGFLRGFRRAGGVLACDSRVAEIERRAGAWHVACGAARFEAPLLVNAAGAWADEIAALAGATPIGLVPRRRTAILVDPPAALAGGIATLPAIDFAGSDAYLKPDAGQVMASPGDETPVAPQDVQPEELDVATIVEVLEQRTHLEVRRVARAWAGLRSFVADRVPVVGFDPGADGFFWLAGQGGFGIMMAPALAEAAAALIRDDRPPRALADAGVGAESLSPARLRVVVA
jgi:D-arginine dehydrogenase